MSSIDTKINKLVVALLNEALAIKVGMQVIGEQHFTLLECLA